jgi:four helix bundle protein
MASTPTGSRLRTEANAPIRPASRTGAALTDAERMDVYRVALDFLALTGRLLPRRGCGDLRDQLDRAGSSIVLNMAEGLGRASSPDKARFYVIARGSALECAAIVDVIRVRGLSDQALCAQARGLLVRVTQMLSKLITRHGSA